MKSPSPISKSGILTLRLQEIGDGEVPLVGGKAANLAVLLCAGLPVPPGFCITTAAFRLFAAGAFGSGGMSLSGTALANPHTLAKTLRASLAETPVPQPVEESIQSALRRFADDTPFAVRSSANIEDSSEGSFAGQFESILNVRGASAVLEAVKACWLSLYSERALAYFARHGISLEGVAMAVVVQEMVPAEVSGVAFTADPVTGLADRVVVEYVAGLGDALVQGRVSPQRLLVEKKTRRILEPVNGEALMPGALVRALLDSVLACESFFKSPQDIEWAVCGGKISLLQARPIPSSLASGASAERSGVLAQIAGRSSIPPCHGSRTWDDRQVWANPNTGEVLPDVVTPMTWSVSRLLFGALIRRVLRLQGADSTRGELVGLVAGRVYFNVNAAIAAMKPFWFLHKRIPNLANALGGGYIGPMLRGLITIPEEDLPDLGFRWPKYILSIPRLFWDLLTHSPRRGDAWAVRLKARMDRLARIDVKAMSTRALTEFFAELLHEGFEGWDLLYLITQAFALPVFQKACRDWLDDPHLTLGYRLFSGLGGMAEAEAGLALWRLAALAHEDAPTESALTSGVGWQELLPKLRERPHGHQFLTAWDAFMAEHGHHCRGELELSNARWQETPDYILGLVRGYLQSIGRSDPVQKQQRLREKRLRLEAECRRRLRNPIKRWLFTAALKRAQKLAVNREEWKNQAVRHNALLRRVLLTLGQRLCEQEILSRQDDVFFLECGEIGPVATGTAEFDPKQRVRERCADYEANRTLNPPPLVFGKFDKNTPPPPPPNANAKVLEGIPVSPGIVSGLARVVLRANDHEQVLPGEILVAPFTDPAWAPYFVMAAGVIMDQGGILSHGSIVAREYGLPAVTNLGSATKLIRTGDLLHIDANRGRVTIVARRN